MVPMSKIVLPLLLLIVQSRHYSTEVSFKLVLKGTLLMVVLGRTAVCSSFLSVGYISKLLRNALSSTLANAWPFTYETAASVKAVIFVNILKCLI